LVSKLKWKPTFFDGYELTERNSEEILFLLQFTKKWHFCGNFAITWHVLGVLQQDKDKFENCQHQLIQIAKAGFVETYAAAVSIFAFVFKASDVMVWHVPNGVDISQWSNQAFLKYYTDNQFLDNEGGSLQALFSKYYPLTRSRNSGKNALCFVCVFKLYLDFV